MLLWVLQVDGAGGSKTTSTHIHGRQAQARDLVFGRYIPTAHLVPTAPFNETHVCL